MGRRIQIFSISLLLALASVVSAQSPVTCGIVDIDGPSDNLKSGTPLVIKVKVTNTSNPQFKWNVSAGTIIKGQGTAEITIDSTGLAGQEVTATVELTGAPSGCKSSASTTILVKPAIPVCGMPFDEYGDINFEDEKARLDNFAIQISNRSESKALIVMTAGRKTFEREAAYRLNRARSYLVGFRGIDSGRIVTVDCGFTRDLRTKLWMVPPGTSFPDCDISSQIPLAEVKFTKPRPKSSKRRR